MKKAFLIFTLLFGQICICQTYSRIISDTEIFDALNSILKSEKKYYPELKKINKISPKIYPWKLENFNGKDWDFDFNYIYKKQTDSIFNEKDKAFIFEQFKSIKDSVWHKKLKHSKLIDNENDTKRFYYFSIPLFSYNKEYAIVFVEYHCGNECSYYGYKIYRKSKNGKWKFVIDINGGMS